jgi:Plasmid stabilization system protein
MVYRVKILSTAEQDIDAMSGYYEKFYPDTALRRYDDLMSKLRKLADHPYMYEEYNKNPKYRKLVSGDYIGFYTVDDEAGIVRLYRVLPGKMDLTKLLEKS